MKRLKDKNDPYGKDSYTNLILSKHNKRVRPIVNFIVNSSHTELKNYTSSCDFKIKTPGTVDISNMDSMTFLGGTIPNFISSSTIPEVPYLLLEIISLNGFTHSNSLSNRVFAVLKWDSIVTGSNFITVKPSSIYKHPIQNKGKVLSLPIRILDPDGEVFSFGKSILSIDSGTQFTRAANTVITSTAHGLTTGDQVIINCFDNASTNGVRKNIERRQGYIVTVINPNSFSLNLDLSAEPSNTQNETIVENAYPLGRDVSISRYPNGYLSTGFIKGFSTISNTNPASINIGAPHGLITGQQIKITGFNNGSVYIINQLMNKIHNVTVTGVNTFTIPVDL